mmetsp:Transcript_9238/g.18816  ORF Transcript_9238/g.18816 Transcript_9238/m.18816 type:complete len:131 (+) Transcript_9238:535-927(+)
MMDRALSLTQAERDARNLWLQLIYLTLDHLRYRQGQPRPPATEDRYNLNDLVTTVSNAFQQGYTLEGLKLEQSLQSTPPVSTSSSAPSMANPDEVDAPPQSSENAGAASTRSQWMRLVFLTNTLVKNRAS